MKSPFETCRVESDSDGNWWLVSEYWKIAMKNERNAKRTEEIVKAAFRHGADSARKQIQKVLGIIEDDEW